MPGLYPLDISSASLLSTMRNASGHCQLSLGSKISPTENHWRRVGRIPIFPSFLEESVVQGGPAVHALQGARDKNKGGRGRDKRGRVKMPGGIEIG